MNLPIGLIGLYLLAPLKQDLEQDRSLGMRLQPLPLYFTRSHCWEIKFKSHPLYPSHFNHACHITSSAESAWSRHQTILFLIFSLSIERFLNWSSSSSRCLHTIGRVAECWLLGYTFPILTYTDLVDSCPLLLMTSSSSGGINLERRFLRGGGFHRDPPSNIRNSSTRQVSGESPYNSSIIMSTLMKDSGRQPDN